MTIPTKRILVFNVNWIGDVIFTTPIFKVLKKHYPQSHIACLAVPRVREILECSKNIDEIITFDEKGQHRSLIGKLRLIAELKAKRFDVVFLLHRSWTRALLVYLAGIPERVGYDTKQRGWLLTHKVPLIDGQVHRSDHYSNVIESYGIKVDDRTCELYPDNHSMEDVRQLLKSNGISKDDSILVVHVGGNWELKRWPQNNFAILIKRLVDELKVEVVIPGSSKDHELVEEIARGSGVKPIILVGKTNLRQLTALMAISDLVISSDSGPMHIANCVGTNVVALFGPTRPEVTGLRGKGQYIILQKDITCNRNPCYNLACPDNQCMTAISVDEVMTAVNELIEKSQKKK